MSNGSKIDDDRPVDPDDELLVAYLDGELGLNERDEVEQRLVDDVSFRKRLQTLQASWDFLDVLPETGSNDKLVESTLELVVEDIVQKAPRDVAEKQGMSWIWLSGALCIAAAAGMFALVSSNRSNLLRQDLADLGLAENIDAYFYGTDLDLMRQLESKKQWNAMLKAARNVGDLNGDRAAIIADTPVDQRAEKLASLSVEDRKLLESRWDRFQRWSKQDRQVVRDSAAAVAEKSDSATLLKTMQTYAAWRDNLSKALREKIESGDTEVRNKAIDDAIKETLASITKNSGESLEETTSDLIYAAVAHFLDRRISADPTLGDAIDKFGEQIRNPELARRFAMRMMLGASFGPPRPSRAPQGGQEGPAARPSGSEGGRGPGGPGGGTMGAFQLIDVPQITDLELLSIIDVLNADSGDHTKALTTLDNMDDAGSFSMQKSLVAETLRQWAEESMNRNRLSPAFEQKSLSELYLELDPDQRDAIDLLPPERWKEEIQRLNDPRRRGGFRFRPAQPR